MERNFDRLHRSWKPGAQDQVLGGAIHDSPLRRPNPSETTQRLLDDYNDWNFEEEGEPFGLIAKPWNLVHVGLYPS